MPRISVVVITMNRRRELAQCIDSILAQDCEDLELVVVDNASTDGTSAWIKEQYPSVHLITSSKNQGVAAGRNRGIGAASAPVCVCIDDDAWFRSTSACSAIARDFADAPDLECLALRIVSDPPAAVDTRYIPRVDRRAPAATFDCAFFVGAAFAVRSAAFHRVGGFWEPLFYAGEELDFAYRLLAAGGRIAYTSRVVVVHQESARTGARWVYFNTRNRPWIAARNLPPAAIMTTTLSWWAYCGAVALWRLELPAFARGCVAAFVGAPAAVRQRTAIPSSTSARIRDLRGRYWY
jgi:GT2 family glycosyltransferase